MGNNVIKKANLKVNLIPILKLELNQTLSNEKTDITDVLSGGYNKTYSQPLKGEIK